MKKVTALIVTYNRLDLLKESISAVLSQTYRISHLIVIDNDSSDGTKEYLDNLEISNLLIKHLEKNLGGSGGFYTGIALFQKELTDDYIWIMDDDTIPTPDALLNLSYGWNRFPKFGFLASNARWIDGSAAIMNVPFVEQGSWTNDMNQRDPLMLPKIKKASFVSIVISRKVITNVGLPYKEFFIWGDDAEYTDRISNSYSSYFVSKSIAIHKMKSNAGVNITKENGDRVARYFYSFRNRTFYARKEKGKVKIKLFLRLYSDLIQVSFGRHVKARFPKIKVICKGIFRGMFFNPKIDYIDGNKQLDREELNRG